MKEIKFNESEAIALTQSHQTIVAQKPITFPVPEDADGNPLLADIKVDGEQVKVPVVGGLLESVVIRSTELNDLKRAGSEGVAVEPVHKLNLTAIVEHDGKRYRLAQTTASSENLRSNFSDADRKARAENPELRANDKYRAVFNPDKLAVGDCIEWINEKTVSDGKNGYKTEKSRTENNLTILNAMTNRMHGSMSDPEIFAIVENWLDQKLIAQAESQTSARVHAESGVVVEAGSNAMSSAKDLVG